ncbi:unnamed protein product [Rotaria magnacalcarata]|uniref:VWFA domain-containing protein n=5 Tax=Rotaria magnacalcarata TaxID=392030 RepID=A0A816AAF8_9BILA|nr:unnamed protein product [Rotaria magnacalcarata]CAF1593405.1 unnamed protein product [Rotaria magnacalcarata]CAF2149223.1 unnamed protein product [Rotaria magnacalcarata]CAF3868112.1 unnamed protein product [Rotaria magnacalcarata]
MASAIMMEKVARPELAKHESSILDLVFVMDCTGSMASYIESATSNIRSIVEEIVVSEKSDIRLALVEYRDHPPQDHTFVTCVHDFTAKVSEMKGWLQQCQASGGGDTPEAVADGLHAVLKLSWRSESTKICILIADAPPHGLDPNGDGFPNGCPDGLDPVQIVREMVEKHITLYAVGVEPPITPYRDFFMSLAYTTGGQYVPMVNAKLLAKVIIGGVREEISLDRLMQAAEEDINREMQRAAAEGADDKEKVKRINNIFATRNLCSTTMTNAFGATSYAAKAYSSTCQNMAAMQHAFLLTPRPAPPTYAASSTASFTFGPSLAATPGFTFGTVSAAAPTTAPTLFGSGPPPAAPHPCGFGLPPSAPSSFTFGTVSAAAPTTAPTLFGTAPPPAVANPFTFVTPFVTTHTPAPFSVVTTTETSGANGAPPVARAEVDINYDVTENTAVNEDQAERIYQKWQHRKK